MASTKAKKSNRVRHANDALFGVGAEDDVATHDVVAGNTEPLKCTATCTNCLRSHTISIAPPPVTSTLSTALPDANEQTDKLPLGVDQAALEKKLGVALPSKENFSDFLKFARGEKLTPELQRLAESFDKMGTGESQPAVPSDAQIIAPYKSFIANIKNLSKRYNEAKVKDKSLLDFGDAQKLVDATKIACPVQHLTLDKPHPVAKTDQLQVILPSEDICLFIKHVFTDRHLLSNNYKGACRFMGGDSYLVMVHDAYVCPTDFVDTLAKDLVTIIHDLHVNLAAGQTLMPKHKLLLELAEKAAVAIMVDAQRASEGKPKRIGCLEHWSVGKINAANKALLVEEMSRTMLTKPGEGIQDPNDKPDAVKEIVEKFERGMVVASADQKRPKAKK